MIHSQELEKYLFRLDSALTGIPVSEKAEIVTEIKSHVLEATARDPEATLKSILNALGEPEQVANKYLLEKGFKAKRPPKHPLIKWIIIGFLGTTAMLIAFITFLLLYFTPVLSVDNKTGEVSLLGGAIHIHNDTVIIHDIDDYYSKKKKKENLTSGQRN